MTTCRQSDGISSPPLRHFRPRHLATPSLRIIQAPSLQLPAGAPRWCARFGIRLALLLAWLRQGRHTLKISIEERKQDTQIKLEGRVAGPWTAELNRVWVESAPRLAGKGLVLDLRGVTYADAGATQLLRQIYQQTHAELIAGTVWTRSLAEEIKRNESQANSEEK